MAAKLGLRKLDRSRVRAAGMEFVRRTAGGTVWIMKGCRHTQPIMGLILLQIKVKTMFIGWPAQEAHPKLSVSNKKDEDLWEGPENADTKQKQATGLFAVSVLTS
jgi:hypothetical protein